MKRLLTGLALASLVCVSSADERTSVAQSTTELEAAVAHVLENDPELLFSILERNPVRLADLVERAMSIRSAKAEEEQLLAELRNPKQAVITDDRPVRGFRQAPVTIVEYSDFECPYCQAASTTLHEILQDYGNQVRLVYKHNPLPFHPAAEPAARYFEAIALQSEDLAWQFHDLVFENQSQLESDDKALETFAAQLELDHERLQRDLYGESVSRQLFEDSAEAQRFGFDGTPAFLINGVSLIGNQPREYFDHIITLVMGDVDSKSP